MKNKTLLFVICAVLICSLLVPVSVFADEVKVSDEVVTTESTEELTQNEE